MYNSALAHFTVINMAVAHCFKKVWHPGPTSGKIIELLLWDSMGRLEFTTSDDNFKTALYDRF